MKKSELKKILLDMMEVIHPILESNHIPYSLHGGSMLGAVRHKGFIPWDDDIDLLIYGKDFERLCVALENSLPSHLKLITPKDMLPNFHDFVIRVVDTRYYRHEPTEEDFFFDNKQNYVCIDFFCMVSVPDFAVSKLWFLFRQKLFYCLALGHRYKINDENQPFIKRAIARTLSKIGKLFSMKRILKWHTGLYVLKSGKTTKYSTCINTTPRYIGSLHLTESISKTIYVPFEAYSFPIYAGYDAMLTKIYGDYMTPLKDTTRYKPHVICEDDDE